MDIEHGKIKSDLLRYKDCGQMYFYFNNGDLTKNGKKYRGKCVKIIFEKFLSKMVKQN